MAVEGVPLPSSPAGQDTPIDWLAEAQHIARLYTQPETGRPSEITDLYRVQKLLSLVARGNYIETACALAGFSKVTFYNWKKQAELGHIAAIAFVNALEKAQAESEDRLVGYVAKAAQKEQFWAAGMTLLERRHPEKWGRRQDSESGPKVVVQIGTSNADVKVAVIGPESGYHNGLLSDTKEERKCLTD